MANNTWHSWYDDPEWPYWNDLYNAENYIRDYTYKWSKCRLVSKEKYGTIRYEAVFCPGMRYYNSFCIEMPFMSTNMSYADQKIVKKYYLGNKGESKIVLWRWYNSWLARKWLKFGWWTVKRAAKNAVKLYPQCKAEIEADLCWIL